MTSAARTITKPPAPSWPAPVALAATGAGAVAMAPLTADPTFCQRAGVGGVFLAAGLSLATARRTRRRELLTSLGQALSSTIGHPSRTELTASRWRGGFVGAPSRLSIRWSPESRSNDPGWASQVAAIAAAQVGVPLEVVKFDSAKNRMWLRIPSKTVTPEMHVDQQRAERNVLKLLGPTSKVVDVETTDGVITRILAEHQDATRFATSGHRARIERTLSEVMPGRWRGVWQLEKDTVTFEVRPVLPDVVWMPAAPVGDLAAMLTEYSRLRIPVAVDEDGQVLFWQPKTVPQGLIVGGTGSGKTSTAHALVAEVTRHDFPIWISDAKRIEFLAFRDWPNVQMVATTIEQQVALVWRVLQLMEQRLELVERGRARLSDFQPLFVILDEFAEMRDNLLDWYPGVKPEGKNVDRHPPTLKHVARIARLARSVRIHLVVLIQRPDAAFLTGEALALGTPVATPTGWTTMGEIRVGDEVYDHTGSPTIVTTTSPVAHGRPCYRVTFSDGSTLVTDANHRWLAHSASRRISAASRYVPLSRGVRWPHHVDLAARLRSLSLEVDQQVTVSQFEDELGGERIALLRRILTPGRRTVAASGMVASSSGRFPARTYRAGELRDSLLEEVGGPPRTVRRNEGEIVTTEHMAGTLTYGKQSNWSINATGPIQAPPADLPIDPWLLGYWLGDGHKAAATIATNDDEVLERTRALGYSVTHYGRYNYGIATGPRGGRHDRPSLKASLRELGLLHDKHIPASYLRASIAQREALLAGLLDSDGTCAVRGRRPSGQVVFVNTNTVLIEGVAQLVASLGFIPTVRQLRPAGVEEHPRSVALGCALKPLFAVSFTPGRQVFSLARKRAALDPALHHQCSPRTLRRYVVSVAPVESVPVRCIAVAAKEHLYLAGERFIPTHNTRDNFGFRMSMGRLSPQGAMMMWENASTGVTLPRDKTGRCMAMGSTPRPVEAQAYRFPDMESAPESEEGRLLEELRPTTTRHERYLFTPVEEARDLAGTDPQKDPDFWDYARVPLVRASDRPDLDPLLADPSAGAEFAEDIGSPSLLLGITTPGAPAAGESAPARHVETLTDEDPLEQYLEPEQADVEGLTAGTLVLVDEDQDHWAVLESEPVDDLEDGSVCLFWRDFDGEEGILCLGQDDELTIRPPRFGEDLGQPLPGEN